MDTPASLVQMGRFGVDIVVCVLKTPTGTGTAAFRVLQDRSGPVPWGSAVVLGGPIGMGLAV